MPTGIKASPVIGRIARYDAIEIVGITLSFHQALLAAFRASDKIGVLRRRGIECPDDRFSTLGGHVKRSVAKILNQVHSA